MCSSGLGTRELALISVFSSLWILAQIYLGQVIGAMTQIHGLVNRLVGWMLMFLLAELTARFGRVSIMASVAALATRIIRRSTSLYALSVGLGYALAGLTFDSLYHLFRVKNLETRTRKAFVLITFISFVSGVTALAPYLMLKYYTLGLHSFLILSPKYAYSMCKGTILSCLGVQLGFPLLPRIKTWNKHP